LPILDSMPDLVTVSTIIYKRTAKTAKIGNTTWSVYDIVGEY